MIKSKKIQILIELKKIPKPIKAIFKKIGLEKLIMRLLTKEEAEMVYQKVWTEKFRENKSKVLEYWERYRYLGTIKQECKINDESVVLDVGCGISTVLHYVKGLREGIDPLAEEYLQHYAYEPGIHIQRGFGEDIPFTDNYFDVVFCSNALDHMEDPEKALDEILRCLKKGKYFVLTVEIFKESVKRGPEHPHNFTEEDVKSLIAKKFDIIFKKKSPWIGEHRYVEGFTSSKNEELVLICVKRY